MPTRDTPAVPINPGIRREEVGRETVRTRGEVASRSSDQLQQQILTALKANLLEGVAVEVDPANNVMLKGTVPDWRTLSRAINAVQACAT